MTGALFARRHEGVWRLAIDAGPGEWPDESADASLMASVPGHVVPLTAVPDETPWHLEYAKAAGGPGEVSLRLARLLAYRCQTSGSLECRVSAPLECLSLRAAALALRSSGLELEAQAGISLGERIRQLTASMAAFGAVVASVLKWREAGNSLPRSVDSLFAVHGEWSNRTRSLLSLLGQGAAPGGIIVLGRPRGSLDEVRASWGQSLAASLPPIVRPFSVPALLSSLPACVSAAMTGIRVASEWGCRPEWREVMAMHYRTMLGVVSRAWWSRQKCSVGSVFYGHTGLADTSSLELAQQDSGARTVHVVHGLSSGMNFVGISNQALFRCGHDSDWHARLGGYGACGFTPALPPECVSGSAGVVLVTNLAHPMNPAGPQAGVDAEMQLLGNVASAVRALAIPGRLAWRPHPAMASLPSGMIKQLVAHAVDLGFHRLPDAGDLVEECRAARWVLCTTSTAIIDLMVGGVLPLMLVDGTQAPGTALARYPFKCSPQQVEVAMQNALESPAPDADAFWSAWSEIKPSAPLVAADLRLKSG